VKSNYSLGENIFNYGVLRFDFVENPGMAFGLSFGGLTSKYILGVFRVFAVLFIGKYIYLLIKGGAHKGLVVIMCLIFSGALGNIVDNLFYGLIFNSCFLNLGFQFSFSCKRFKTYFKTKPR